MDNVVPGPGFWSVPVFPCPRCGEALRSPVHRCPDQVRHPHALAALDALRRGDKRGHAFFLESLPDDERQVVEAIIEHAKV